MECRTGKGCIWSVTLKVSGRNLHVLLQRMNKVTFCMGWKQAGKGHGTEPGVCGGFV